MTSQPIESAGEVAAVIVLAAGAGTRMRSSTPKVLHSIGGRSLLEHAVAAAAGLSAKHLVVVIGHGRDQVEAHLAAIDPLAGTAVQEQQNGTGDAVRCGLETIPDVRSGTVVVTYGDVPLLTGETLHHLVDAHANAGSAVTVLTAQVEDPTGYGRILRDPHDPDQVAGIVEQKDADPAQRRIGEINSGIYAFDVAVLRDGLSRISTDNAQGELYLTDVLALAHADGRRTRAVALTDRWQTEGVNDRVQLATLGRELNERTLRAWMVAGVTVVDPLSTWVDVTVQLAPDVTLLPGVHLQGRTSVARGAVIGPDSTLADCVIGEGATVIRSHGSGATLLEGASCGPFTYLRPGTVLGARSRAGAFVEVKASTVGTGSKVPHLSYVGDAEIGDGVNVGAATVFVNYDGVAKHRTVVGDHARIGSDSMLVAPLTIGAGAYTAAGSVITQDVPPGAMAVARSRQRNVEGWVARQRPGSLSAVAAATQEHARRASHDDQGATPEGAPDTPPDAAPAPAGAGPDDVPAGSQAAVPLDPTTSGGVSP